MPNILARGAACKAAPSATLIALVASPPISTGAIGAVSSAIANILTHLAGKPSNTLLIVVQDKMGRDIWPHVISILRVHLHVDCVIRIIGKLEGDNTILCLRIFRVEEEDEYKYPKDRRCKFAQ